MILSSQNLHKNDDDTKDSIYVGTALSVLDWIDAAVLTSVALLGESIVAGLALYARSHGCIDLETLGRQEMAERNTSDHPASRRGNRQ